jgi:hypothetical protein
MQGSQFLNLVAITVFSPDSITEIPHPEPAWLA